MLEVGNGGMTDREYEAHFSLWALLKAPLLIGCDLTNMSEATRRLLGNTELIAINQDPLGKQGRRIQRNERPTGYIEVYAGEVVDGIVIVLFNRTKRIEQISANFRDAGWKLEGGFVKDLISKHDYGYVVNSFTIDVKPHGAIVLKLTECKECHRASVKFLQ
jgi:alpha-galactosidase